MTFFDKATFYFSEFTFYSFFDILLVTFIIYGLLLLIQGTRTMLLLRGLLILGIILLILSTAVDLPAFSWLIARIFPVLLVALPVIFQPELRRALERVGQTDRYFRFFRRQKKNPAVLAIADACLRLSQRRHGALIVIEQTTDLQEYIDTGVPLDAVPTPQLLLTIFDKHTELHDGAIIVRDKKLAAAACVMPLSTSRLRDSKLGLRHRASLGISEVSDAVIVVVSEETGHISIAHNGRLIRRQDPTRLDQILQTFLEHPLTATQTPDSKPTV
ncbi:MAG TPA: diadenylate cyclase CdaA [Anaerolineae bacterium]|nr:diadenylate cyclase CdaA [Anaerolineae bacterium]